MDPLDRLNIVVGEQPHDVALLTSKGQENDVHVQQVKKELRIQV